MRIKINRKKLWLKDEIEKNNNFSKSYNKKIRNQNNEDQIGKHNTINFDWMMKLKTNNFFTKELRKKLETKNKDQIEKYNICKLGLKD